ncbi:hypothetical protein [Oleidesulfovibrio sp.]|uniref:hypothetical protein n=1 Tax=Oleidesulfovibrio sp. TaxID=2909707 RepID=UPI003A8A05A4
MNKNSLEAWEMMSEAKDALGMPALERIFKVGHKQIYKQMRNPDYSGDSARPVIQRVRMLLHDLDKAGADDLARAMLGYMAEPLGMHCIPNAVAEPDKPTLAEECLDDLPALVALHKAMMNGEDPRTVEALHAEAVQELDQTITKYREGLQG